MRNQKKSTVAVPKARFRRKSAACRARRVRTERLTFEPLEPRLVLDGSSLVINEFMAVNDSIWQDEDGEFRDWIEIHNPTESAVNLDGWYLTDRANNLTMWEFPARVIQPDEYLVVAASGKDRDDPNGQLHTDFKLSSGGEYLALVEPDASPTAPGSSRTSATRTT